MATTIEDTKNVMASLKGEGKKWTCVYAFYLDDEKARLLKDDSSLSTARANWDKIENDQTKIKKLMMKMARSAEEEVLQEPEPIGLECKSCTLLDMDQDAWNAYIMRHTNHIEAAQRELQEARCILEAFYLEARK